MNEPFFCFRSNLRVITRLETLATQANGNEVVHLHGVECQVFFVILFVHRSVCGVKCFGEVSLLDELDP